MVEMYSGNMINYIFCVLSIIYMFFRLSLPFTWIWSICSYETFVSNSVGDVFMHSLMQRC